MSRTLVKWTFNAYPERGFPMDSCVDFGVANVAGDLVDSTGTTIRSGGRRVGREGRSRWSPYH